MCAPNTRPISMPLALDSLHFGSSGICWRLSAGRNRGGLRGRSDNQAFCWDGRRGRELEARLRPRLRLFDPAGGPKGHLYALLAAPIPERERCSDAPGQFSSMKNPQQIPEEASLRHLIAPCHHEGQPRSNGDEDQKEMTARAGRGDGPRARPRAGSGRITVLGVRGLRPGITPFAIDCKRCLNDR